MATYDLTTTTPSSLKSGDILNVPYSGRAISITLPKGIYKLEVWGAQGGNAYDRQTYAGGKGGYASGTLKLISKTATAIYVGGQGTGYSVAGIPPGGWNGGGNGGYRSGGSGGGGTDIRTTGTALTNRIIVAGGGGGGGYYSSATKGGVGGGTTGGNGGSAYNDQYAATGGTQSAGGTITPYSYPGNPGSLGQGGAANTATNYYSSGGGGGGGYYGGAGSGYYNNSSRYYRGVSGGGGGSGYVANTLTSTSLIAGNSSFISPTGASETGHSGDGYARITVIKISSLPIRMKVSGEWREISAGYAKISGEWRELTAGYSKVSGEWKGS